MLFKKTTAKAVAVPAGHSMFKKGGLSAGGGTKLGAVNAALAKSNQLLSGSTVTAKLGAAETMSQKLRRAIVEVCTC